MRDKTLSSIFFTSRGEIICVSVYKNHGGVWCGCGGGVGGIMLFFLGYVKFPVVYNVCHVL